MKAPRTSWRPAESESLPAEDVSSLRRTLRDVVALSALPSIWVDCDLPRSLQNLTDVLRAALRAYTVCVRLRLPDDSEFSSAASDGLSNAPSHRWDINEVLDAIDTNSTELVEIQKFNGSGPLNALPHPIFFEGRKIGCLVACYKNDVVPAPSNRLLLQVAGNQIALLFQRHQDQEERLARKLAEDRLRNAEHHYQQLVHSLPAAVYTCDSEGRITLFNEAAAKLWGRRPKIGEDLWCGSWKIFKPDGSPLPLNECPMAVAIREGRSVRGQEIIVERPDGTRAWVLPHPDPIRDESGKIVGTVNMLVQVDELKRAEQALRESENRIRSLLTLMPAAVYACDAEGRITFYNNRAVELWGREPRLNDSQQKFCAAYKCWFGDTLLRPEETPMATAIKQGKAFRNLEPVFERRDGEKFSVLVNIDPLFDSNGKPAGAINVFQDVTPLKKAEQELRARSEHLQAIVENTPECVKLVKADGTLLAMNDTGLKMVEADSAECVIGKNLYDIVASEYREAFRSMSERVCSGRKERLEFEIIGLKGTRRWMETHAAPITDPSTGELIQLAVTREVTDRKHAEKTLRDNERLLRELIEALPAAVYTTDAQGRITLFNQAAVEFSGRVPQIGSDSWCVSWKLYWPDGTPLPHDQCPMAMALKEGRPVRGYEAIAERPDGTRVNFIPFPTPLRDADGKLVGAINMLVDITERKVAETKLFESEQRHRQLLSLMPSAVYTCDREGRITFFNRRAAELWGREPALGDEDQKFCGAFKLWLPDGSPLPHAQTPMAVAVSEGVPCRDHEVVIERPDGSRVTVTVNIDPLFNPNGERCGAINVFQDITARKTAEQSLAAKVRQQRTVAELGLLALRDNELQALFDRAVSEIARTLDIEYCKVLELLPGGQSVLLRSGVGWTEGLVGKATVSTGLDSQAGYTLASSQPVVVKDLRTETRFNGPPLLHDHGVVSGLSCIIAGDNGAWGVLGAHTKDQREFTENDVAFLQAMANVLATSIQRQRAEEALRESEGLLEAQKDAFQAAMRGRSLEESLGVLVRHVIDATGGRARAAFYVARPDGRALRHIIGMPEHYAKAVDNFPISAESLACGLAVHTGRPEIAVDVEQEPKWESYRWLARHHNFRACWSFPVRTPNSVANGTLAMYFQEPTAPTPRELELATVIAHAATVIISRHQQSQERERAEEALRKRGERLQLLSETLAQLLSARDPETIVRELFPKVAAHLGVDTYFNFMVNEAGDALKLHSCAGIPEETARGIGRLEFGQAICGTVAQTRSSIHATDIQNSDYDKAALVRGFGIQGYACNPLIVGERLLGTLSFASRTRTAFDEDELQFLQIISQYAAVALDRLRQTEQLRESEERFRAVLDNSTTVIYIKDTEGRYLMTNARHAELFHVGKEKMLGKTDAEIFPAEVAAAFRENDLTVIRTGQPLEIEEVAPHDDGSHTYISIKFPLRRADGSIYAVAGISTDITERKRAQESAARLAAIVEHSDDAIISIDLDATIRSWNRGAQRLFGYSPDETIGQPVSMLIPEGRQNEEPSILKRIRDGETVENYETIRRRKGGALLDISLTVSPVKDVEGNIVGASKVARDITDKIRAREKLERAVAERTAQLRDTVAELEAFSYSVAHDMRAPLRSMNSYSRFLEEDFAQALPLQAKDYLHRIAASATRLDALITDVLNYSKISRSEMVLESVDVEKLTREIIDSYPDFHESGATILVQSPLPRVVGNPAALTQCISNLLSNAVKFVRPDTTAQVRVWAEKKGELVRLWIEDNGIGISEEGQRRIFHMFQRLNPASEFHGTGIGLTIVRKAVERMGGRVGVESQPGSGSRFWIELKRAS